jgi:hypothetical protein
MRRWTGGSRGIRRRTIPNWCSVALVCVAVSSSACAKKPTPFGVTLPTVLHAQWTWRPVEYYVVQVDAGAPVRFRALSRCSNVTMTCDYPFAVYDLNEHLFRVWAASASAEGPKTQVRFALGDPTGIGSNTEPTNPANLRLVVTP